MKTKVILSIVCLIVFSNSCIQAQNTLYENGAEKTIKDFYTEYCSVWNNTPTTVPANVLDSKIDSVAQKYCTRHLRIKAKEWNANDQGLYTQDYGIVFESLKTLTISKDASKANCYIVCYITTNDGALGKQVSQKVILHISVVKDKDSYKINDIN